MKLMKVQLPLTLAAAFCSSLFAAPTLSTDDAHALLSTFADRGSEISKTMSDLLRERKRTANKKRQEEVNDTKKEVQAKCDEEIKKISSEHKERKKNLQSLCTARKKELTAQAKAEKDELGRHTKQALSALNSARSKATRRFRAVETHHTAVTDFFTTLKTHARDAQLPDIVTLITQEEARLDKESRALSLAT